MMKFAIIVSTKDTAGMNIKRHLLKRFNEMPEQFEDHKVYSYGTAKLYTTDNDSIFCENIDSKISADMFIFATKHQSQQEIPSLSTHAPGNWSDDASYGGKSRTLCIAPASYLREAMIILERLNRSENLGFDVVQECTHHGPFLKKPALFIEIGSTEKQWNNETAGRILSEAICALIEKKPESKPVIFGIGGLHTTPNFKKLLQDYAIGHVCPKYMLEHLTPELIKEAIEKSMPKTDEVWLDWKGLKEHKEKIKQMLEEMKIDYKRTKDA